MAIEALKNGASDYVSKPIKANEALLKIRVVQERKRLQAESALLRGETLEIGRWTGLVGKSRPMVDVFNTIVGISNHQSRVLLVGEPGTGKKLVARALHDLSMRSESPFVPVNCGTIAVPFLQSRLFGRVNSSSSETGETTSNRVGLIERAHGGTLFLHDVDRLPFLLQVQLLHCLGEEKIQRVGGDRPIGVDARVVATTALDFGNITRDNQSHEDLCCRFNVLLQIPPRRVRKTDIRQLPSHFIAKSSVGSKGERLRVTNGAMQILMDYNWSGNVRELEDTIVHGIAQSEGNRIEVGDLPSRLRKDGESMPLPPFGDSLSIKKATRTIERELIRRGLEKTGGNRTRAAELLEISHRALLYEIKEYGLG